MDLILNPLQLCVRRVVISNFTPKKVHSFSGTRIPNPQLQPCTWRTFQHDQTSQVSQQSDPLRPCHWHDHCAMGVATVPLDGSGTFESSIPLWAWPLRYRHDSWDLEHSAAHDSVDQEPAASPSALALSARRRQISAMLASVGSAEGPAVQPLRSHPQSLAHHKWCKDRTEAEHKGFNGKLTKRNVEYLGTFSAVGMCVFFSTRATI